MNISILILLFTIIKNFNLTECPFKDKESLFNFYSKGILNITKPFDEETFYYCINGNSNKGYFENYGKEFFEETGIYIGAGINLGTLNKSFIDIKLMNKLKDLIGLKGDEAKKKFDELGKNITLNDEELKIFNKYVYMNFYQEFKNNYLLYFPDKIKEISFFSFFVKFYNTSILNKVDSFIKAKNFELVSYYILSLNGGNYTQKKLWYLTLNTPGEFINNFYYHIGIIFDSKIQEQDEIESFKSYINNLISNNKNNKFTISDSKNFILQDLESNEASKIFEKYIYSYKNNESLINQTKNMINYLENQISYQNIFFQKILLLILNDNTDLTYDIFNNTNINVILYGKISHNFTYYNMTKIISNKYNIIPFNLLNETGLYKTIIYSSINRQIPQFVFNNKENEILEIKNIKSIRNINYQYFKIILTEKKENNKSIHISLTHNNINEIIENNSNVNITIFVSLDNPYPDIYNNTQKNLGLNINDSFINLNLSQNYFYILIFGSNLDYSLKISNCISNCSIETNGIYNNNKLMLFLKKKIWTFSDCYKTYCPIPLDDFYKLYSIGISNNEKTNFFFEIYNCLFFNNYCVYFKDLDNYNIIDEKTGPIIGNDIILKNESDFSLLNNYKIPLYLIDRIYPLSNRFFNSSTIKNITENYNLNFTIEELNIINSNYIESKNNDYLSIFKHCHKEIDLSINVSLFLRSLYHGKMENETKFICEGNYKALHEIIMNGNDDDNLKLFQKMLIENFLYDIKSKVLISFVVGKSMIFNPEFKSFLSYFVNYHTSISYYDEKSNDTFLLKDFSNENYESIIDKFINYWKNESMLKIDMNSILIQQKNLFKYYDYGFQKVIIIISQKKNNNKTDFSYDLIEPIENNIKGIEDLGINIVLYTNIYNKSKVHNKNYWLKDYQIINVINDDFFISDINLLKNYINIMPIPMTSLSNMILDLKENEFVTFEFKLKDFFEETNNKINQNYSIKFTFDSQNVKIYLNKILPFPNEGINEDIEKIENSYDNLLEIYLPSKNLPQNFYMTVKGLSNLTYLKVDVDICTEQFNCRKQKYEKYIKLTFIIGGILLFLFGIYVCLSDSKIKKESNIYEKKN